MTDKVTIKLVAGEQRIRAQKLIGRAPDGYVVTISEPSRTLNQNALLWAALSDIARAKPGGREMSPEQWKAAFMAAAGFKPTFIPALEGTDFLCLGYKSSRLTKGQFSDLIETIFEFGARHDVSWSEPNPLQNAA